MSSIKILTAVVASAACVAGGVNAATMNALDNGGFETNDGTTAASWASNPFVTISSDANTGSSAHLFSAPTLAAAVSEQNNVANGGQPDLIVGETGTLSFFAKGVVGETGNFFATFRYLDSGGAILFDSGLFNIASLINPNTYTEITLDSAVVPTGANAVLVQFSQGNGPVAESSVLIDDVTFATVPEPGSLALLGLGGLVLARRRRRA